MAWRDDARGHLDICRALARKIMHAPTKHALASIRRGQAPIVPPRITRMTVCDRCVDSPTDASARPAAADTSAAGENGGDGDSSDGNDGMDIVHSMVYHYHGLPAGFGIYDEDDDDDEGGEEDDEDDEDGEEEEDEEEDDEGDADDGHGGTAE